MKNLSKITFLAIIATMLSSCAASYHQISPQHLSYSARDVQEGVEFEYKYDVLRETGNKKYAKKEDKKHVNLVAVKITNSGKEPIQLGKNAFFYAGSQQVFPMSPYSIKEDIKQNVAGYIPYAIFTFLTFSTYEGTTVNTYPIGYAVGPGLTLGNMIMAGSANQNLYTELVTRNVFDKVIKPGETIHGLIGLKATGYTPLSVRVNKEISITQNKN